MGLEIPETKEAAGQRDIVRNAVVHFTYKELMRRGIDLGDSIAWQPFLGRLETDTDFNLSYEVSVRLIAEAVRLSGDPDLGLSVGFQRPISAYGQLLPTLMSSETYYHALEVAVRYHYVLGSLVEIKLQPLDTGDVALIFQPRYPVGSVRRFLMQKSISHTLVQAKFLNPSKEACKSVSFDFPGTVPARLRDMFESPVLFQQPENRIVFSGEELRRPIPTSDAYTHKVSIAALDREMAQYRSSQTVLQKVELLCLTELSNSPTAQSIASNLGMSERTLRRELAKMGTSFRDTVQTLRKQRAVELLADPSRTLTQVSLDLGFKDIKTMRRNIVTWTGMTPSQIRNQERLSGKPATDS